MQYVISLGGSLIVPDKIDINFLKGFKRLIEIRTRHKDKFLILCGGGETCRLYQKAAKSVANVSNDALDWIGIETNQLNANLLRWIFGAKKYEPVPQLTKFPAKIPGRIMVALGATVPGNSSDSASVLYAKKLGIKMIVNLTNVAGVFDRDPSKFKNAKLITRLTWPEFRRQFSEARRPGQHKPFDPSIAKLAQSLGVKVAILSGRDMDNAKRFFEGKRFRGTTIE